jgi:hypothetical protein
MKKYPEENADRNGGGADEQLNQQVSTSYTPHKPDVS